MIDNILPKLSIREFEQYNFSFLTHFGFLQLEPNLYFHATKISCKILYYFCPYSVLQNQ